MGNVIFQEQRPFIALYTDNNFIDLSEFVQHITINKAIGRPSASCTIQLYPMANFRNGKVGFMLRDWQTLIMKLMRPYQIIWVQLDRSNPEYTFIGLIDLCRNSTSINNGIPSSMVSISLSSILGKSLNTERIVGSQVLALVGVGDKQSRMAEIFGQEWIDFLKFIRGLDETGNSIFIGTPDKAVKWIVKNGIRQQKFLVYDDNGNGKKVNIADILDFRNNCDQILKIQVLKNEFLFATELSTYTGNMWNYIEQCLDIRFYEMFTEIDSYTDKDNNLKTVDKLNIRPIPYSYKKIDTLRINKSNEDEWLYFDDLPISKKLKNDEIRQEDISITDKEYFNYFTLEYENSILAPQGSSLSTFGYSPPIINGEGIMEFGLRELKFNSRNPINFGEIIKKSNEATLKKGQSVPLTAPEENKIISSLLTKREKALEWYSFPYFESGQVTIRGDTTIKVGTRIQLLDREYYLMLDTVDGLKPFSGIGIEYYCQSVQHSWSVGGEMLSTIGLIRGIPIIEGKKDNEDAIFKYLEWIWKNKFDTRDLYMQGIAITVPNIISKATEKETEKANKDKPKIDKPAEGNPKVEKPKKKEVKPTKKKKK